MKNFNPDDTICALATGGNVSAIAIIRISGKDSVKIVNNIFSKNIIKANSHTIHYGRITNNNKIIDEVLVSIFKGNKTYTGETTVEISCHGSIYIQDQLLQILIKNGCRMANPGEFTMRAFKNGKIDLTQAEAVADLIASESEAEQQTAMRDLRGGFSSKLQKLRNKLIDFASLIELELDFSEEDVEFADRKQFQKLLSQIKDELQILINSFSEGNVMKNGIPVSIIGAPNVGKSTLLNTLLNEEKAIVSEIEGTTRDSIEDKLIINGISFRFIDTAGIRKTKDKIEKIGIKKTLEKAKESEIVLLILDASKKINKEELLKQKKKYANKLIIVINKIDIKEMQSIQLKDSILISAKEKTGIEDLKSKIVSLIKNKKKSNSDTIVTNIRHYEELKLALNEVKSIFDALNNNISSEFLAIHIRQALSHIGLITGEVTTDTLLANIFQKFCIGK